MFSIVIFHIAHFNTSFVLCFFIELVKVSV
ncbi:Uncharacterised protein [Mycobacteroides abscessus subsp. abscessus]|nr:Uncharacterised protein [Mycobacteroides abscessus subsp. abscessus]